MTHWLTALSALRASDSAIFGAKAANLGELMHAGFSVPAGFALSVETTELDEASREELDLQLETFPGDATFAVRSSGAFEDSHQKSWAGQFESFLNIRRGDVQRHIELCRASTNSERALAYSKRAGIDLDRHGIGVIVQLFIPAEVAGVCFTRHPVTKDDSVLVIEVATGLGQALVGGLITPDTYVVRKSDGAVVEQIISRQTRAIVPSQYGGVEALELTTQKRPAAKLPAERLEKLRHTLLAIESHFACPQDIEFAVTKSQVAIVQTRPITA